MAPPLLRSLLPHKLEPAMTVLEWLIWKRLMGGVRVPISSPQFESVIDF